MLSASAPHPEDGHRVYPGTCKNLKQDNYSVSQKKELPAWRLKVPDQIVSFEDLFCGRQKLNLARDWGDFVIRRKDGGFSYQLACAVDDYAQNVNFVLRGRDLLSSTFPQRYIIDLLQGKTVQYMHVPLLVDAQNERLSKRQKSLDLGEMRKASLTSENIIGYLAWLAGQVDRPESMNVSELLSIYSRKKLPGQSEIKVDPDDLYKMA